MYFQFAAVLIFILLGTAFVFGNLLLGYLIRPSRHDQDKKTIYECGEPTIGSAWIRFNSRFYTVALVYLLFDVEVVVLVPALLVLREMKLAGGAGAPLVALLVFLVLLALGLAYEWYYGNLDWIGPEEEAGSGMEGEAGATESDEAGKVEAERPQDRISA
jgi:NADH-quinone oxidoreductase subunit A